ncbi:hypothetical protein CERZMDRAFT_99442 [Cercospora zeae-maydis SCOH1-5]|uniref:BTB domain-containing protein n=1 Tax=Cercospora zeae-maydis SCOH1-5 TaxID=717836 RepID=A0A6A6FAD0_9PEZI|nr:hypothetical protein CERZMDRAFT_99442 [Cercospora zeae-maydis SCOH1-5]
MAGAPPPPKKMRTGEAVLDGHIHDSNATFDMKDIYNTKLVKIVVGRPVGLQPKTFKVSREQVCAHSTYLAAAFKKDFKEAHEKTVTLEQFTPEVFAIFLTFIHTLGITFAWPDAKVDIPDPKDPTTWSYDVLIECYILGDYIGARAFRDRIFETIQLTLMQDDDGGLCGADLRMAYEMTPENSQLRKLLVEDMCTRQVHSANIYHLYGDFVGPPMQFMIDYQYRMNRWAAALVCEHCSQASTCHQPCDSKHHTREDAVLDPLLNWCRYHEHETEEQKELCKWKARALEERLEQEGGEDGEAADNDGQ